MCGLCTIYCHLVKLWFDVIEAHCYRVDKGSDWFLSKTSLSVTKLFVTDKDLHDRSILHVNYYSMFAQESITPLKLRFDQLIKYNNTHVHDPTLSNTLQGTKVKCTVLYTTWVATKIIAIFLCNLVLHVHVCETVDCNYGTSYYGDEVHVSNVYLQTYMIWYVLTTLQSLKCFRLTHCGRERREHTNSTTVSAIAMINTISTFVLSGFSMLK